MTINKKFLKFISTILVLFYHLWVLSPSKIELPLQQIAYIGVDIFFFLSAYSMGERKIEYKNFLKNRFIQIYGRFVLFTIIVGIYKGYSLTRIFNILTGIELFRRGGGAFLWFVPAIMILYIIFPLFVKWENKYKEVILFSLWLITALLISNFTSYTAIFIFLNRIPVILLGYMAATKDFKLTLTKSFILLVVGMILVYFLALQYKLREPIYDLFYVIALPLVVAIIALTANIKTFKLTDMIGNASLEVYGLQMIFGYDLAIKVYKYSKNFILTNLVVFVVIIGCGIIFNKLYLRITKPLTQKKN